MKARLTVHLNRVLKSTPKKAYRAFLEADALTNVSYHMVLPVAVRNHYTIWQNW
jgi:hypothetical protein